MHVEPAIGDINEDENESDDVDTCSEASEGGMVSSTEASANHTDTKAEEIPKQEKCAGVCEETPLSSSSKSRESTKIQEMLKGEEDKPADGQLNMMTQVLLFYSHYYIKVYFVHVSIC